MAVIWAAGIKAPRSHQHGHRSFHFHYGHSIFTTFVPRAQLGEKGGGGQATRVRSVCKTKYPEARMLQWRVGERRIRILPALPLLSVVGPAGVNESVSQSESGDCADRRVPGNSYPEVCKVP